MKLGDLISFLTSPIWVPALFAAAAIDEFAGTSIAIDTYAKASNRAADLNGDDRPYPDEGR